MNRNVGRPKGYSCFPLNDDVFLAAIRVRVRRTFAFASVFKCSSDGDPVGVGPVDFEALDDAVFAKS